MKINNIFMGQGQPTVKEGAFPVRAGEVVQAVIKNKNDKNEATLMIKGQEIPVKFEGEVPTDQRVSVQLVRIDENGVAVVKAVDPKLANATNQSTHMEELLAKSGVSPELAPVLQKALQTLSARGYKLDQNTVNTIRQYLSSGNGSIQNKLETIVALADKQLEFSLSILKAMDSALHEKPAVSILSQYLEGMDFTMVEKGEIPTESEKEISTNQNKQEVVASSKSDMPVENKLEQGSDEHAVLESGKAPQTVPAQDQNVYAQSSVTPVGVESRDVIVTQVSKRLSQLTLDFKKDRQEIVKFLDQSLQKLETPQKSNPESARQLIDASIKKLDHAILKGDYMLYSDMSTEKELLQASSQLAKAKEFVANGNMREAERILHDVKKVLSAIEYKPSMTKMVHMVSNGANLASDVAIDKEVLKQQLQGLLKPMIPAQTSSREVYETVKRLGLMHESHLAQSFTGTAKDRNPANLKSMLLKLNQLEQGNTRAVTSVDQALTNLTGQQLVNKQDASNTQQVVLQLPVQMNEKDEQVKVFINSEKKGKSLDWENCNLYFVLETHSLGNLGIAINASNRSLSITLKNDLDRFAEKAKPFTEESVQRLNEIGYKVGNIVFQSFQKEEEVPVEKPEISTDIHDGDEGGYDFKI